MVEFNCTRAERDLIDKAVKRYRKSLLSVGERPDTKMNLLMDVEATHCNGCPLDLARLVEFNDMNLCHDIDGINRHIDRTTGALLHHFLPRCALPQRDEAQP